VIPLKLIGELTGAAAALPPGALWASSRQQPEIIRVRQRAMYLCRILRPDASLAQIGAAFGRDHTTVAHAVRAVGVRLDQTAERAALAAVGALLKDHVEVRAAYHELRERLTALADELEQVRDLANRLAVLLGEPG
jgi:chromosomal replication initiation ATPase DnaA